MRTTSKRTRGMTRSRQSPSSALGVLYHAWCAARGGRRSPSAGPGRVWQNRESWAGRAFRLPDDRLPYGSARSRAPDEQLPEYPTAAGRTMQGSPCSTTSPRGQRSPQNQAPRPSPTSRSTVSHWVGGNTTRRVSVRRVTMNAGTGGPGCERGIPSRWPSSWR